MIRKNKGKSKNVELGNKVEKWLLGKKEAPGVFLVVTESEESVNIWLRVSVWTGRDEDPNAYVLRITEVTLTHGDEEY